MTYNYDTISQKEKIKDPNIAKIMDYVERHAKGDPFIEDASYGLGREAKEFLVDGVSLMFRNDGNTEVCKYTILDPEDQTREYQNDFMIINTKILASNIVGLWGSIKNFTYNKKESE